MVRSSARKIHGPAAAILAASVLMLAAPRVSYGYEISPEDSAWVMENLRMVKVPTGSFVMGTEDNYLKWFMHSRPVRQVAVDSFEISAFEVTQGMFRRVMGFNPSLMTGDEKRPVEQVSWFDAVEFCNLLSELAGYMPPYDIRNRSCIFERNGFRLPTEAEWEYACRAGNDNSRYCTGDKESDLQRVAWYRSNSSGTTHPVGSKTPNAWGLYDMHGNVWEWCNDWMENYGNLSKNNPRGPGAGNSRVLRGGGWHYGAEGCHVAYRQRARPEYKISAVGFRVVRNPSGHGPLVDGKDRVPGDPYDLNDRPSRN